MPSGPVMISRGAAVAGLSLTSNACRGTGVEFRSASIRTTLMWRTLSAWSEAGSVMKRSAAISSARSMNSSSSHAPVDVNAGSGAATHLTSMVHRLHRFEISSERAGNCPHRCRLVRRDVRAEIDNRAALTRVPGADDDSGEAWRSQQDTDAQLSDAEASARRNRADLVDRLEVTLESGAGVILVRAPGIVGRERLVASPRAEQHAAEERRVPRWRRRRGSHTTEGYRS